MKDLLDIIFENENSLSHLFNDRKSHKKKVIVCGKCGGEGTIPVPIFKGHSEGTDIEDQVCINCDGSGMLEVEVTLKYKPFKPSNKRQQ